MRRWLRVLGGAAMVLLLCQVSMAWALKEAQVPRISKEELKGMLGNPDVVVMDVRVRAQWEQTNSKIKGALREEPEKFKSWAEKHPKDKTYILYCS